MQSTPANQSDFPHLLALAQNGDIAARNELVARNIRLVGAPAAWYAKRNHDIEMDDLIQCGRIGIIRAVERYDINSGFTFSTYAMYWIKHELRRLVRTSHWVGVSASMSDSSAYIERRMECGKCLRCVSQTGRCDAVVSYERACLGYVALDDPIKNGPDTGAARDIIPDPVNEAEMVENGILYNQVINCFRNGTVQPKAEFALRCSFGLGGQDPVSHAEIGRRLGCKAIQVGKLIDEALAALRECMGEQQ